MCAGYGLGGGPRQADPAFDLLPMDEESNRLLLTEWMRENAHQARITGVRARNLNPVIHAAGDERRIDLAWWWLHQGGRPAPFSAFNARDDRLLRSWWAPFQRRALLPATWYDEKGRIFALPDDALFGIAAILTATPQPVGPDLLSYAMVTRDAVGTAAETHPRMPLLLPRELHDAWLDPARPGDADLVAAAVGGSERLSHAVEVIDAPVAQPTLF